MSSADKIKEIREARGKLATEQQRRASNPQKSVWVEASAGTGKTKAKVLLPFPGLSLVQRHVSS